MNTVLVDDCRKKGHAIFETFNGLAWCRRCHERTDAGFASHSRYLLENIQKKGSIDSPSDKGYHDMSLSNTGGSMSEETMYPSTMNIFMGATAISQKRRAAYEKSAQKAGNKSVGEWARETLDKAAGFKE